MKRKLTLSKQIAIIFSISFIITTLLLGFFLTQNLNEIHENTIYSSLESEARTIRFYKNIDDYTPADNIAFISYSIDIDNYITSENINEHISIDSIPLLIRKAELQKETSSQYKNIIDDNLIYYIIVKHKSLFGILNEENIIIFTDSTIINQLVKDTFIKLFIVCFIAYLIGFIIILIWTGFLQKSIKYLINSVMNMSKNRYNTKIKLKRYDELRQLSDSIDNMREQISNNEKSKQEILQGIGHDLKTPIAVIQSYAEAVKDGMCDPVAAAQITIKQTKRLNEKVVKLLNLSRLDYLNSNLINSEKIRIDTLIKDLLKSYAYQTDVSFELNLDEVSFIGDIESWNIVIENILDNAIRYAKSKIVITLNSDFLSIYNDGEHIKQEYVDSIFNPYEKSHDGKFGLGLSIVYKTATLFGYKIKADNKDIGVDFVIYR